MGRSWIVALVCLGTGVAGMPRIIGGEDAAEGEFPYMASLRIEGRYPDFLCAGSVLARKWILTTAKCCDLVPDCDLPTLYVHSGTIYLDRKGRVNKMADVIRHEGYDPYDNFRDDICLVQLSEGLILDEGVQQIALPSRDCTPDPGDRFNVTGWGSVSETISIVPEVLQKATDLVVVANDDCADETGIPVRSTQLCATSPRSPWEGDAGDPLARNGVVVGLLSRATQPAVPNMYTKVASYVDWIQEKLGADADQLKFGNINKCDK